MSHPSEFRVLGGLELSVGDALVPIGGPKPEQVLSVLVANRCGAVSVDRLVETLWPEQAPNTSIATARSLVSRLRGVLPDTFAITLEAGGYHLTIPDGGCDADRFESLLERAGTLDPAEACSTLESALALWRGPAFGPYADLPEIAGEAMRLDELRLVATDRWAEARMTVGDAAAMVGELEALVHLHPLRECYWRLLLLALHRTGRRGEALRRAAEYRAMLADELGLEPSLTIRELEAQIVADDPALHRPDPARPRPSRRRIVSQLLGATSFVGRDPDVDTLATTLHSQPLLTLTGPGGVGKTRLAMRVAANALDDFVDGVTVVELAPIRDPTAVAQAIANALDIQRRQNQSIDATIEDHLASSNRLLLLDNCEHVTDALAPLVDRLRSRCPRLRILATSREPLGLAGEVVEVLAALALPASDGDTAEQAIGAAAVELFVSRAAAGSGSFTLTDANAPAVVRICRRLDGLPLALELAAARLRSTGVDALAARLDERIELSGQTQRGADGRARTLHDLVSWSHDLLSPREQQVFDQLSVFAGGFDLSAAEAICSPDTAHADLASESTLGTLASLVDKSMVVFVDPGPPRYRLLEPLREFALDRLRQQGALEPIEDRHVRWFVEMAERGSAGLEGPDEPSWSNALNRDFDNLRLAHLTAMRRHDADLALRLVMALAEFSFRRIRYEVAAWAEATIPLADANEHPGRAAAYAIAAYGSFVRGDCDRADELAHQALALRDGHTRHGEVLAVRVIGNTCCYREEIDQALIWLERLVASARRSKSDARLAHALYMQSIAVTCSGDRTRSEALARESHAVALTVRSPTALAQADYSLGLALEAASPMVALEHHERASKVAADAGNRWIEAFALTEVHWLRAQTGNPIAALAGYAEVIDTWFRGGDWANQWLSLRRVLGTLMNLHEWETAAVLHGALTSFGTAHAFPFEPDDAARLAADIDLLRSAFGSADFDEAVARGAAMTDREIVTYVIAQIETLAQRLGTST